MADKQLECRVVMRNGVIDFDLGMYDPLNGKYAALGTHPKRDKDRVVRDLKTRIEREGHLVTFSEMVRE